MYIKEKSETKANTNEITFDKLLLLFLVGCVLGVLMEGTFCVITKGHWESHVVSVFGAFNILYGTGAVLFYVGAVRLRGLPIWARVLIMTATATVLELLCGLLLRDWLGMRAWNYENSFLNYQGLICAGFSCIWGAAAFGICELQPRISRSLERVRGRRWHAVCVAVSLFMALDLGLTAASIVRWSERHYGVTAQSKIQTYLDQDAPDSWMQSRFVEWEFLDTINK